MLIRSFPNLLKGIKKQEVILINRGKVEVSKLIKEKYPERLLYGLTGILNIIVSINCCLL